MKNIIYILIILPFFSLAQVGIGTTNPNINAALEIATTDKGLLLPRLNLSNTTSAAPLTAHVSGMLVYNLASIGDVSPGFYYNNGTAWQRVATSVAAGTGWNLDGNAGTNSSNDFLGTLDNQALTFRVNNVPKLRLETNGTIATLNTGNSIFIGDGAGINDDLSNNENIFIGNNAGNANTTGELNTAIGANAFESNISGSRNISFGLNSLRNNTIGNDNIAIGDLTLENGSSNNFNVAIGNQSFRYTTTGTNNVGVGYWAGRENRAGTSNVAIGSQALQNNTNGSFNTAIGNQAYNNGSHNNTTVIGYNANAGGDNRVNLGNTSITRISGQVNFTTYSDRRIKKNIKENVAGLDFIMKLRPVTYNLDINTQNKLLGVNESPDYDSKYDIEKIKISGFIAQEVDAAAKDSNYNFSGVKTPTEHDPLYALTYAEFVVPLVKAVQEQQKMIEEIEREIATIKKNNKEK